MQVLFNKNNACIGRVYVVKYFLLRQINSMARWSRGQDAALSRRNHGFDSRTSYVGAVRVFWQLFFDFEALQYFAGREPTGAPEGKAPVGTGGILRKY